jgi:hypothetical protein
MEADAFVPSADVRAFPARMLHAFIYLISPES